MREVDSLECGLDVFGCHVQPFRGRPGVVAVPTGQFDQLVQDPGLPCTIGALVGEGFFFVAACRWAIVSSMKTGIARIRRQHRKPRRYAEVFN
jgi:hypothetical protein